MSDRPQITRQQIQNRATDKSYTRGKKYYKDGLIRHTIRRDSKIEARCIGSYGTPYRLWAVLSDTDIMMTGCNCEYDWGGDCKHIIAMLLTYLNKPDSFETRASTDDLLQSRNKDELIALITQMVERYPDLQELVDQPAIKNITSGQVTIDIQSIRNSLWQSFQQPDYPDYDYDHWSYYEYEPPYVQKINDYIKNAKQFAENDAWETASQIYCAIVEEFTRVSDYPSDYPDDGDSLAITIETIITELSTCLLQQGIIDNPKNRRSILNALLDVYIWDINHGGFDISLSIPQIVLEHALQDDLSEIYERIETTRDRQTNYPYSQNQWQLEQLNEFLIKLAVLMETDPAIILNNLQEQGMYYLLVDKLLGLERIPESTKILETKIDNPYEFQRTLDLFLRHQQHEAALDIAESHAIEPFNSTIAHWLIHEYAKHDRPADLIRWYHILMLHEPDIHIYRKLKQLAETSSQWHEKHDGIIIELREKQNFHLLTEIHLEDEDWQQAWQAVKEANIHSINSWSSHSLDLKVAEKSRYDNPERSISVYKRYARQYIDKRGRDNYARAADLLTVVQELYDTMDEFEVWEILIDEIRTEFKRLRALQDELNKAGL